MTQSEDETHVSSKVQELKDAADRSYGAVDRARVLTEALPWIKEVTGQRIVIKYGGAAMHSEKLQASVMSDILLMRLIGMRPIIVHGGGPDITRYLQRLNIESEFINGLRVTTPEVMEIVTMVLVGKVNSALVSAFNQHGPLAVGLSGLDASAIKGRVVSPELGRVGEVTKVDIGLFDTLIEQNFIPVVASIATDEEGGALNINADSLASAIASAVGAHKLIFMTDVDGLYKDFDDKSSLISVMRLSEAQNMLDKELIARGMRPKVQASVDALNAGVNQVHILNGTAPSSLILELLTNTGIGTMFVADEEKTTEEEPTTIIERSALSTAWRDYE